MSDFKLYLSGLLQREGGRWGGEKREKGNGTGKGRGREEDTINMARRLLYVDFQLRTARCLYKGNWGLGLRPVGLRLVGLVGLGIRLAPS